MIKIPINDINKIPINTKIFRFIVYNKSLSNKFSNLDKLIHLIFSDNFNQSVDNLPPNLLELKF